MRTQFIIKSLRMIFLLGILFWSCTSCDSGNSTNSDDAVLDNDSFSQIDSEKNDKDMVEGLNENDTVLDDLSDEDINDIVDSEKPDVDMYCPYPKDAKYPYFRQDGTIHFCRPCDTPDEYDPQCLKSIWKDLNKEVYDIYKYEGFEDNEYVVECYPWPCEWDVKPESQEQTTSYSHKCDISLNPSTWANPFGGAERSSSMDNGKVVFWLTNYRIADKQPLLSFPGYTGQRTVLYDINTGKYEVIGLLNSPYYRNGMIIADNTVTRRMSESKKIVYYWIVGVSEYKDGYKYEVLYRNETNRVMLDSAPFMTDKWTVLSLDQLDENNTRSLVYSKTGEWKWTTLVSGSNEKTGELSIAGDNLIFAHAGKNTSYICDLSKSPQSLTGCKKLSRDGESAGFPKFDKDNPNRIIYRSIKEGEPANKMVVLDISKEPWTVEKEFQIPSTEEKFLSMWLMELKSNVILYEENYLLDASGYQEDGKLCYYRIDKGKVYCSKPLEDQKSYGHGYANFEGKYLFWQPMYKSGYILRDMECYCKEEGVCPFED